MQTPDTQQGAGYWYPTGEPGDRVGSSAGDGADGTADDSPATGVDVLTALRSYRSVETGLRKELGRRLGVNETDLAALRYLFDVWQAGGSASPKELAVALTISSASTTLVVDRLENAGFIRRRRHPVDRRAVILEAGEKATEEFRASFDIEKRGVLAAADALTGDEIETVTRFLRSMEQVISEAVGPQDRSGAR